MKTSTYLKHSLILLTSATLLACGGSDKESSIANVVPSEVDPIIRGLSIEDQAVFQEIIPETSGSVINISIFDATTQELLDVPVNLIVTDLSGENALEVEGDLPEPDTANGETYSFAIENGTIAFNFDDGLSADEITIRVQAFADGYVTNGQSVTLGSMGEIGVINLSLVDIENTPDFVSAASTTGGYNNGQLTSDVMIEATSVDPDTGEEITFSFELPQSSALTDAEGNPLNEGELDINITYFDPRNGNAAELFPGGLLFDEDAEGVDDAGEFITAGLVNIEISDEEGNQVSELGSAGTITVTIPDDFTNPTTGEAVQVGDEIPLWSRDDATGQWTLEETAVVTVNAEGELSLTSQVTHLTSYNYDWFGTGSCPSRTVNLFDAVGSPLPMTLPLYISITNTDLNYYSGQKKAYFDAINRVYRTPPSTSTWDVFDSYNSTTPIASLTVAGCGDITFNLDYQFPEPAFELVIKSPVIVAPTSVNYWEVERLLKEADIPRADREDILEITHPGSMPELDYVSYYYNYAAYFARAQRVTISSLYQRFLDDGHLTRDDIATIQSVLAMQFHLQSGTLYYSYYSTADRRYKSGSVNVKDIPAEGISLPQFTEIGSLYMSFSGYITNSDGENRYFYGSDFESVDLSQQTEYRAEIQSIFALAAAYDALIDNIEEE